MKNNIWILEKSIKTWKLLEIKQNQLINDYKYKEKKNPQNI